MNLTAGAALDARIIAAVARWRDGEPLDDAAFDELALALFAHQVAANEPYARFAGSVGFGPDSMPRSWREIPAVPASAFKDVTLAAFDASTAELEFHSSGTTEGRPGIHYMQRAAVYDAVLCAGFERYVLRGRPPLRFLNLVPDPRDNPRSSLGYMMLRAAERFGEGEPRFYLRGDSVAVDAFRAEVDAATAAGAAVCIAGTAFALAAAIDALGDPKLTCAPGSVVVETGGFKGRRVALAPDEFYRRLCDAFGVAQRDIVAEYGMTELTSQYYDDPASRDDAVRRKTGPPWLRAIVVGPDGREAPAGEVGLLRHVDLANRSSVVAIATEDLGYAVDGGFVLLGRAAGAALRGCSLDHEDLVARPAFL